MRTKLLPVLLALLLVPLTACDSTSPDTTLVGDYTLFTIDGSAMPWTLDEDETARIRVTSGTISFFDDGTFLDHTVYEVTQAGATSEEAADYTGTFIKITSGATMAYDGMGSIDVQIANGLLTQLIGGSSWIYQK